MDHEFIRETQKHFRSRPEIKPHRRHRGLRPRARQLLPFAPTAEPRALRPAHRVETKIFALIALLLLVSATLTFLDSAHHRDLTRVDSPREALRSVEVYAQSLQYQLPSPSFEATTCASMKNLAPRLLAIASLLAGHDAASVREDGSDLGKQAEQWRSGCEGSSEGALRERLGRLIATSRSILHRLYE